MGHGFELQEHHVGKEIVRYAMILEPGVGGGIVRYAKMLLLEKKKWDITKSSNKILVS